MIHILTTIAALFTAFVAIFFYAPIEASQGLVQKIFYVHVGCAITMYLGFFISFIGSLMYLIEKKVHWDELAVSGAEVGYFLCVMVLITGPLWAKPVWGTWWTWEPRLTTTFLLWLLYSGYLILRGYFGPTSRGRSVAAVTAIVAFLDVPIVHFSVKLWRGIHPNVVGAKDGGMPSSMAQTLVISVLAVMVLFSLLFMKRLRLEKSRNRLNTLIAQSWEKS